MATLARTRPKSFFQALPCGCMLLLLSSNFTVNFRPLGPTSLRARPLGNNRADIFVELFQRNAKLSHEASPWHCASKSLPQRPLLDIIALRPGSGIMRLIGRFPLQGIQNPRKVKCRFLWPANDRRPALLGYEPPLQGVLLGTQLAHVTCEGPPPAPSHVRGILKTSSLLAAPELRHSRFLPWFLLGKKS